MMQKQLARLSSLCSTGTRKVNNKIKVHVLGTSKAQHTPLLIDNLAIEKETEIPVVYLKKEKHYG